VLSLRKVHNQRVRQPLANLQVAVADPKALEAFVDVMKSELNLKNIELLSTASVSQADFGIVQQLEVNARALGPRLGKQVQDVIRATKAGNWTLLNGIPVVTLPDGEMTLQEGEYAVTVRTDRDLAGARAAVSNPSGLDPASAGKGEGKSGASAGKGDGKSATSAGKGTPGTSFPANAGSAPVAPPHSSPASPSSFPANAGPKFAEANSSASASGASSLPAEKGAAGVKTTGASEASTPPVQEEAAAVLPSGGFLKLDLTLTQDLINEGLVRDVIREVQDARKNAGFEVSDRINLKVTAPADRLAALNQYRAIIVEETLVEGSCEFTESSGKETSIEVSRIG
jgi:hypothetical protein